MKLADLEAKLVHFEAHAKALPADLTTFSYRPVATLAEAHGLRFLCPEAFQKNGGTTGTHSILVWFEGSPVPPEIGKNKAGATVRWRASGTSLDNLTLQPSIQEQDDGLCSWHGFVTNGNAA